MRGELIAYSSRILSINRTVPKRTAMGYHGAPVVGHGCQRLHGVGVNDTNVIHCVNQGLAAQDVERGLLYS